MSVTTILLPVFVQVALVFALLFRLLFLRIEAVRAGAVDVRAIVDDDRAWPRRARLVNNAIRNQFELPVLFYALVAFALLTRKADIAFVVLSWVFVASRLAHALVHAGSDNVRLRLFFFAIGVLILLLMWALFALALLAAPVVP
ncbi:MAPEG family protein [Bosea sp. 117]|uniref:MAPEG family protein n=1 Tax=Bosea sp. 117 TaxID=1125973 RepID=UPI0004945B68|nr:MAPEG family protein [Bosea sp. 117]